MSSAAPVLKTERSALLDVLRGLAILGILFNNIYGFSGYGFLQKASKMAFETFPIDKQLSFFQAALIEGKFYSLFSLLFGIGFSIILLRNKDKPGGGLLLFYRRLAVLMLIGFAHVLLVWEGDILLLYALVGMILPLFRHCSNRSLLLWAAFFILLPVGIDLIRLATHWEPGKGLQSIAQEIDKVNGIPIDDSFAGYLFQDGSGWKEWRNWQDSAIFYRYSYILQSSRIPKVLGMFLIGFYAGRHMIYAQLEAYRPLLKKTMIWGYVIGLPFSFAMAYFERDGKGLTADPWGMADTISYALGVAPLALAYAATIALIWKKRSSGLMIFAPVGRMALTNYLFQSAVCIFLFYGWGLGLGQEFGLVYLFLIVLLVYGVQLVLSHIWLRYFDYGPMEWIWRQLTYGKKLPIRKKD